MNKIEHIGIAVKDLNAASQIFSLLFNQAPYKTEEVISEKVATSFFKIGESKVELIQALDEDSAISKFINNRGEGIHHIAFAVEDIHASIKQLQEKGFNLIKKEPVKGADDKLVCFIHPKSSNGVLIELCQEMVNNS